MSKPRWSLAGMFSLCLFAALVAAGYRAFWSGQHATAASTMAGMEGKRTYAAAIIAAAIILASLAVPYAAGYVYLASRVAECEPDLSRQRIYRAAWLAYAFAPAAMVEDACSTWKVTTEAE